MSSYDKSYYCACYSKLLKKPVEIILVKLKEYFLCIACIQPKYTTTIKKGCAKFCFVPQPKRNSVR